MSDVVFVDCETTGLDPDRHEIWEVGLIVPDEDGDVDEYVFQLPVDLGRADPIALKISGFYDRRNPELEYRNRGSFARDFEKLTRGKHLVGAVVSFDEERLRRLLVAYGSCPGWHYHIIDVEAMAIGFLRAQGVKFDLPWKSETLGLALGVDPLSEEDRHTALGDARWAKDIYDTITNWSNPTKGHP